MISLQVALRKAAAKPDCAQTLATAVAEMERTGDWSTAYQLLADAASLPGADRELVAA